MALKIGINDNLILSNAVVNEKGGLELTFKNSIEAGKSKDLFDELLEDSTDVVKTGNDSNKLLVFPLMTPKAVRSDTNEVKSATQISTEAQKSIVELQNALKQIAMCIVTSDKAKIANGLSKAGINNENKDVLLPKEETLAMVSHTIFSSFVDVVTPFLNNVEYPIRLLLIRQSKAKSYPTLRKNFLADNPIAEPANIPLALSKLKFTAYEEKNGLHLATEALVASPDEEVVSTDDTGIFE